MWGCVVFAGRKHGRAGHTRLHMAVLSLLAGLALGVGERHAGSLPQPRSAEVWSVEAAFREAVQLWVDERFEALWERGLLASRHRVSREAFARGMRHRVVKPTCCWGQLRDVRVHLQTAEEGPRRGTAWSRREDARDHSGTEPDRLLTAGGGGVAGGAGETPDQARGRTGLAAMTRRRLLACGEGLGADLLGPMMLTCDRAVEQ